MTVVSSRSLKHISAFCFAMASLATTGSARAASETVVYSFTGGTDGAEPSAGLINIGGTLYGTTAFGGGSNNCPGGDGFPFGCGSVFSVTPAGAETVVYSFKSEPDGAYPYAGLTDVGGTLYGTTFDGGSVNDGTVFNVTLAGAETVVHSFTGGSDGALPSADLIKFGGTLYGTTSVGGGSAKCTGGGGEPPGCGTVFKVTKAGTEKVLHSFGRPGDGIEPSGGLVSIGGTFYGTTSFGPGANGLGTVFSVTTARKEAVVYSFKGGSDGLSPSGNLINVDGTLYGTTILGGGAGSCEATGCGTVFTVTPAGAEAVVYSFRGSNDGAEPKAGLINVGGTLYGTTRFGGGSANCPGADGNPSGCGTVFRVTKAGTETVVYAFKGGSDGAYPNGLINVGGTLYGTTAAGGGSDNCLGSYPNGPGCGTVFAVIP